MAHMMPPQYFSILSVTVTPHREARSSMNPETDVTQPVQQKVDEKTYVAPKIESVMTPEDLSREVQYAGNFDATLIG